MRRKQEKHEPLITSIAAMVKRTPDTRPFTEEEVRAEKRELHGILKDALGIFADSLKRGEVELNSSLDLERVVKMLMMVLGEPEGVPQVDEEQVVATFEEPLSLDDADVRSVYERLTQTYNMQNDEESHG